MELAEAIKTRRSIRKFKPDPVPREILEEVIDTALWAPSGMNTQMWRVFVLSGEKKKEFNKLIENSIYYLNEKLKRLFKEKMQQMVYGFFKDMGGAPHTIVVAVIKNPNRNYQESEIQAGAALMQNICLAAHDKGLGTCWMTAPLWVEDKVMDYLGISEEWKLVAVTPIGYPDQNPPAPPRKPNVVTWLE
ncbi:MAG TPA: nitroreductase family protein [Clostridia bacterium]|jgi:nitroreductase|nr:nitroreductase family protein [Clostridia bacterium]